MIADELVDDFRRTLLAGGYNLLLGSGVSLDSKNGDGEFLRSAERLRIDLCRLTGAEATTSLSRVANLLTQAQIDRELVRRYANCQPGPSLSRLPEYVWRRLFTFNIDDALDTLYERRYTAKQIGTPLNFDFPYEPTPDLRSLQIVHLHGWSREPAAGFVFSISDYARVMKENNPWMHMLGEIISTESFIIAGTSLNEVDLEYYLSKRTPTTPRKGRGPSLLIEPNPTVVTHSDCKRHGLELIEATLEQFLAWVGEIAPSPPTVAQLTIPDATSLFQVEPSQQDLLRFFADFELIAGGDMPLPRTPTPFLYGRAPSWKEVDQHVDIERRDNRRVADVTVKALGGTGPRAIVILDSPGTGKTTCIRRVAHDYAAIGKPVLAVRTLARIEVDTAIAVMSCLKTQVLLIVDGIADHIDQVAAILDSGQLNKRVTVLASERSYRRELLQVVFRRQGVTLIELENLTLAECHQLIERYRQFGLVAHTEAIRNPTSFASQILADPISIAVCRILNDFRPFDRICRSLWMDASPDQQAVFLAAAVAYHCHPTGIRHSVLQGTFGPSVGIADMISAGVPLTLAQNPTDDEFVIPGNPIVGERLLSTVADEKPDLMYETFLKIARGIAPRVNVPAIRTRSPEARLAARLMDGDKIVRPFLRARAERFYIDIKPFWEWNSRYWEQRALLIADVDMETALRYARHAVAIEPHSNPLTTLGKLLLQSLDTPGATRYSYDEAHNVLLQAITIESEHGRSSFVPFYVLLNGTINWVDQGGRLNVDQWNRIAAAADEAERLFGTNPDLTELLRQLDRWLM